jgi:hypothetical protein
MNTVKRMLRSLFFVLLFVPVWSQAQSLSTATPEEVGFSRERLDRIAYTINGEIAKGIIPGGTLLIARNGKIAYYNSFGKVWGRSKNFDRFKKGIAAAANRRSSPLSRGPGKVWGRSRNFVPRPQ